MPLRLLQPGGSPCQQGASIWRDVCELSCRWDRLYGQCRVGGAPGSARVLFQVLPSAVPSHVTGGPDLCGLAVVVEAAAGVVERLLPLVRPRQHRRSPAPPLAACACACPGVCAPPCCHAGAVRPCRVTCAAAGPMHSSQAPGNRSTVRAGVPVHIACAAAGGPSGLTRSGGSVCNDTPGPFCTVCAAARGPSCFAAAWRRAAALTALSTCSAALAPKARLALALPSNHTPLASPVVQLCRPATRSAPSWWCQAVRSKFHLLLHQQHYKHLDGLKPGLFALAGSCRTGQCRGTAQANRLHAKGRRKAKLRKRSLLLSIDTKARQVAVKLVRDVSSFLCTSSLRSSRSERPSRQLAGVQLACTE